MGLSSPQRLAKRAVHLYRTKGMREIVRALRRRFAGSERDYRKRKVEEDRQFDAGGYDTGGVQHIFGMDLAENSLAAAAAHHIAAPPAEFAAAMAALDIPIDGLTFIDLGSGKGRALLLAAEMPFGKVIGVEFARELHDIAEANIARRAPLHQDGKSIVALHGDATAFAFPDDPTILFLYNPFDPPVLTAVVENALASWRRHPRPFRVVYLNPVHPGSWTRAGWVRTASAQGYAIYAPPGG